MSDRYKVTTFDVCAEGFERLRNYREFILVASVNHATSADELLDDWLRDIDACMRPDDFDFAAVEDTVRKFWEESVKPEFNTRSNPYGLEAPIESDDEDEDEITEEANGWCNAYLYIEDTKEGAHFPVY